MNKLEILTKNFNKNQMKYLRHVIEKKDTKKNKKLMS